MARQVKVGMLREIDDRRRVGRRGDRLNQLSNTLAVAIAAARE